MADKPSSTDESQRGNGWLHGAVIPILAAVIIGLAGIAAAVIARDKGSQAPPAETTTVIKTVPVPQAQTPASPRSQPGAPTTTPAPCLPSSAGGDAGDNSMGAARGPLVSGEVYRGTLIKGDQEWWGFCVRRPGRVDVRVENVCDVGGSGATNMIAEVLDSSGEVLESFRPDPGRFDSIALQAKADAPYYVHIFDLGDVDLGDEACGEAPWALTVTGALTPYTSG